MGDPSKPANGTLEMDTGGNCFICLNQVMSMSTIKSEFSTNDQSYENIKNGNHHRLFSLRKICQYLKINLSESTLISKETVAEPELKGALCEECAQIYQTFSRHFLELKVIQRKMEVYLGIICDKILKVNKTNYGDGEKKCNRDIDMESIQLEIVNRLRKKIVKRFSTLIGKGCPRVRLERVDRPRKPKKMRTPKTQPETESKSNQNSPSKMQTRNPMLLALLRDDVTENSINQNPTSGSSSPSSSSMTLPKPKPKPDKEVRLQNLIDVIVDDSFNGRRQLERSDSVEEIRSCNDKKNGKLMTLSPSPTPPVSDCNLSNLLTVEMECDVCHLKVSDISTHLYTVHYDRSMGNGHVGGAGKESSGSSSKMISRQILEAVKRPSPSQKDPGGGEPIPKRHRDDNIMGPPTAPTSTYNPATGQHKCNLCPQEFKTHQSSFTHYRNVHLNLNIRHNCPLCPLDFPRWDLYLSHRRNVHRPQAKASYKCHPCGEIFSREKQFFQHQPNCPCQPGDVRVIDPLSSLSEGRGDPIDLGLGEVMEVGEKNFLSYDDFHDEDDVDDG